MNPTRQQAYELADRIEADPRNGGRYDAHGLSQDAGGWYVCVNDGQATGQSPSGRTLEVRSWDEWEAALASG